MWTLTWQPLSAGVTGASIWSGALRLSFAEVIRAWQEDATFRSFWIGALRDAPHETYCWETPSLTRKTLARPFECVFVGSPALKAIAADPAPFVEHFKKAAGNPAVVFESLGGDAMLAAPLPLDADTRYAHLAAFVRSAPAAQAQELWRVYSDAVQQRLSDTPLWLSTAGLGVHWLHLRVDSRPKYYRYRLYAEALAPENE